MEWPDFLNQATELQRTTEQWELLHATGPEYIAETGRPAETHMMLLVSADGFVVAAQAIAHAPDAGLLGVFATMACLSPEHGEPRRPLSIVTSDISVVGELAQELQQVGIIVRHGGTPAARHVFQDMLERLTPEDIPDFLAGAPDEEIRAYFTAAEAFFRSRPWESVPAEKFVAFRLEGRAWRYLSLMGRGGEEFGFTVYDDWLDACRVAYAHFPWYAGEEALDDAPDLLMAIDAIESMALDDLEAASPADIAEIRRLKIRQTWQGEYALIQRHTYFGPESAQTELATYTALMQILAERVNRARGRQVTSIKAQAETDFGTLDLRFPARGDEDSPVDVYYEVSFHLDMYERGGSDRVPCAARIVAPASAKWPQVLKALRRAGREAGFSEFYLDKLVEPDDTVLLWFGHGSAVEPSPTIGQLESLETVAIPMGQRMSIIEFEPTAAPAEAGISASLIRLEEEGQP